MPTSQTRIKSCDNYTHDEVVTALVAKAMKATQAMVAAARAVAALPPTLRCSTAAEVRRGRPELAWLSDELIASMTHPYAGKPS